MAGMAKRCQVDFTPQFDISLTISRVSFQLFLPAEASKLRLLSPEADTKRGENVGGACLLAMCGKHSFIK